ncbi:alpha/beta fold hydrolase [Leptospira perdikensis]|uniref:Alpha/beta hydrolase n=1 Tax=Leptospira perdikensis TaxID=2484948 RepID=A0A4R9JKB9_9LEPT|nr:alpha/beta hydrolase [Leptospira perdikensis]TGL45936.1 alpha/beta hydrolase [Leptospira perdikensis]
MNFFLLYRIRIFVFYLLSVTFLFCKVPSQGRETIQSLVSPSEKGEIHFLSNECKNKKKVLVLIHGSPGSSLDFESYLKDEDLQNQFCILLPDRLGYGGSWNQTSVPNLILQGRAIHSALIRYLEKERFRFNEGIVVGHSYGGPVALRIAMEKNNTYSFVWKSILLSAPIDPDLEELHWYNQIANLVWVQWILPDSWIHSNEEMYTLKTDLIELTKAFENSSLEILSVHGDEDQLVSVKNVYYFTKWKPSIKHRIQILKGENHFIPWTNFKEIKEIILAEGSK